MKNKYYSFCSDAGHGWVKVPLKEIKSLGIAHKITKYSYMRKDMAYLEEDCDLAMLFKALESVNVFPVLRASKSRGERSSRIRGYISFNLTNVNWVTCMVQ